MTERRMAKQETVVLVSLRLTSKSRAFTMKKKEGFFIGRQITFLFFCVKRVKCAIRKPPPAYERTRIITIFHTRPAFMCKSKALSPLYLPFGVGLIKKSPLYPLLEGTFKERYRPILQASFWGERRGGRQCPFYFFR